MVKILTIPLETLSLQVLSMNHYPELMQYMAYESRRTVALKIVQAVLKSKKTLDSEEIIDQLMSFIMPLLEEDQEQSEMQAYEFEEEQESIAKLLHLVKSPDLDVQYALLQKWKKVLVKGGDMRMKHTIPPFIFKMFDFIY